MRKFETISEEQWNTDIIGEYDATCPIETHLKPRRSTKASAGYDFISPVQITVKSHAMTKIPTGVKVCMSDDDVLLIYPRSSIGFKTGIRLANTTGVVDSDYYNNANNEGHIFIKLYNPSDEDFYINIGDKFAQGIFMKYETVDDEENIDTERTGGFGSTGK